MPRKARIVVPGVAHHVTQRGTNHQLVFYTRSDRDVYLRLLKQNGVRAGLRILAYCLMPNHIHLVAVPEREDSLAVGLRRIHGRYAQYLNARRVRSGHLWQNRFYSCALDETHLWAAIRYVERNPVRASIVDSAEVYEWSSAAAHLGGKDPHAVLDLDFWTNAGGRPRWMVLLSGLDEREQVRRLVQATHAGNPLGSDEFVARVKQLRTPSLSYSQAGVA